MKILSMLLPILGFALFTSLGHADALYTCTGDEGDSLRINFTREGQQMSLRSLYVKMNFSQAKRNQGEAAGYVNFLGRYPTGDGYADATVAVSGSLVRGKTKGNEVVGTITLDSVDYFCKPGAGKLRVSRATRNEFAPQQRGEPCKLTSYYNGMTFMPPRVVCDYGNGFTLITGGGRPF